MVVINGLHDVCKSWDLLYSVEREGYIFTAMDISNVFDGIVVRNPENIDKISPKRSMSNHSLQEHIDFINKHKLEKAYIIANNIDFITQCPTLKHVIVNPIVNDNAFFDYSPLYELNNLESLSCNTTSNWRTVATVDYSKFKSNSIHSVGISKNGHINVDSLINVTNLSFSEVKSFNDLNSYKALVNLKKINITQSNLVSLSGIENLINLEEILLAYNRKLTDISSLKHISKSLKSLYIESSPKITDFSCLEQLESLEDLSLYGSNVLPNLNFLNKMKKLKYFIFSMHVGNNDLSPCLQIPYAVCEKGKKEYNYKNKDLPKNRTN